MLPVTAATLSALATVAVEKLTPTEVILVTIPWELTLTTGTVVEFP